MPDSALHYFPYGATRAGDPAALPTAFNFTGQRLDMSTGLLYYGARYYDPALGRFISADTVVPEPGNPQGLNRYSYCLNNPPRYTDPTGHLTEASVQGEPVPQEPEPLPPIYDTIVEFIDQVINSDGPVNVGVSKQAQSGSRKLLDFRFGGWFVYTRLELKVGQCIRSANSSPLYFEPERAKVEFPVGRQGKYYVQAQWKYGDIPRVAQGFEKEAGFQDSDLVFAQK